MNPSLVNMEWTQLDSYVVEKTYRITQKMKKENKGDQKNLGHQDEKAQDEAEIIIHPGKPYERC